MSHLLKQARVGHLCGLATRYASAIAFATPAAWATRGRIAVLTLGVYAALC